MPPSGSDLVGASCTSAAVKDWQRTSSSQVRHELISNPVSAELLRSVLEPMEVIECGGRDFAKKPLLTWKGVRLATSSMRA